MQKTPEFWSSRLAYILVTIGATVGLGNLWRFPYAAGSNGGGAFVLIYLLAVFSLALPLFMSETLIGRISGRSAPYALKDLSNSRSGHAFWPLIGLMGVVGAILIMAFYSVIAGMSLAYMPRVLSGGFDGMTGSQIADAFSHFVSDPWVLGAWHALFSILTIGILAAGVRRGIEAVGKVLMPMLFVLLVFLVGYALWFGDTDSALSYLFSFDIADIDIELIMAAFGQAFFTMSIGIGGVLVYGAYIQHRIPIGRTAGQVAMGDTLVALLAGLAIFPLVFAYGLDPADGAGLAFVTLPIVFTNIAGGAIVGFLFFALFTFAAITSALSILEVAVAYAHDRFGWGRPLAATVAGGLSWLIGLAVVLSFSDWAEVYPLSFVPGFEEQNPFGTIDRLVSNYILPLGGMSFAVFAGWVLLPQDAADELGFERPWLFTTWRACVRWFAPGMMLGIFVYGNFIGG